MTRRIRFTRDVYLAAIEDQRKQLQNIGLYVAIEHRHGRHEVSSYIADCADRAAKTKVLLHKRAYREGVDVRRK